MEPASSSIQSQINYSFFFAPAVPEEIILIIRNSKPKKAIREQDIDTKFLKYCYQIISRFIGDLCNSCIEQGKFSTALKIAEVIPIFKKKDPNQATNYRPLLLLLQFSKILEKLKFNRLYAYLKKCDLFTRHQHGFRKKSSTVYTICSIYDRLIKNIDDGLHICCIFFDLTKAFDTANHAKLLNKMYHTFGMRGIANQLLESYLSDRKQYTKVLNHKIKNG